MSVTTRKFPKDFDNHIGLEVEFLSPYTRNRAAAVLNKSSLAESYHLHSDSSISEICDKKDLKCKNCKHQDYMWNDGWCIDCGDVMTVPKEIKGLLGHELNVIFKEKDLLKVMKVLNSDLKKIKAEANTTCGLHVHLDMRNRNAEYCYAKLVKNQTLLFTLVNKARKKSEFCKRSDKYYNLSGHYNAINGSAAYREHKTIEVRLHHGTVDIKEIYNWIGLLTSIVNEKPMSTKLTKYIKEQKERMKAA